MPDGVFDSSAVGGAPVVVFGVDSRTGDVGIEDIIALATGIAMNVVVIDSGPTTIAEVNTAAGVVGDIVEFDGTYTTAVEIDASTFPCRIVIDVVVVNQCVGSILDINAATALCSRIAGDVVAIDHFGIACPNTGTFAVGVIVGNRIVADSSIR